MVRRGRAATIVVDVPGRPSVVRPAWEWCDALPEVDGSGRIALQGHAILRVAEDAWPLEEGRELLGFVERFGEKIPGRVILDEQDMRFLPEDGSTMRVWPLLDVTAVQPASSALQLKVRERPVVTLKFLDCSVRLWEQRIQEGLRRAFRAAGRGEIVEFQPRVSFR